MNWALFKNSRTFRSHTKSRFRAKDRAGPTKAYTDIYNRSLGNNLITRLYRPGLIQAKLMLGPVNDRYEQEADRMADRVVGMPEGGSSHSLAGPPGVANANNAGDIIRRSCASCNTEYRSADEEERPVNSASLCPTCRIQTKPLAGNTSSAGTTTQSVTNGINTLGGRGRPLSASQRQYFEPRIGHKFTQVRVHTDNSAARLASGINARAFTVGNDVVFAAGQYQPATREGKRLLAHELTHVVQQGQGMTGTGVVQAKRGPGGCGWLDTMAATTIGSEAHWQIQAGLRGRGLVTEMPIPRASKIDNLGSLKCQPLGTPWGYADVARKTGIAIGLSEIKPWRTAKFLAKGEALHYKLRASQSKQRLLHTGLCGKRPAGPDDLSFNIRAGPFTMASSFILLKGAVVGRQNFGPYALDRTRDLWAEELGPGAIGYWCKKRSKARKKKKKKKGKRKGKGKGKPKAKAKPKPKPKPKPKAGASAGAASIGFGISIFSTNVGAANAGVGISVGSQSAGVGTAGAGISWFSESAAAGSAGAGASIESSGAAAGTAGAGLTKQSESVAVGAVGAGKSEGSMSAAAGAAGAGTVKDSMTAGAGVAGTGEVKESATAVAGAAGSGKVAGAVGAGTGSPKEPVDPKDVTGPGVEEVPPGEGEKKGEQTEGGTTGKPGETGAGTKGGGSGPGKGGTEKGEKGGEGAGGEKTGTTTGPGATAGGTAPPGTPGGAAATPGLGVLPVFPVRSTDAEREKIAAEAAKVAKLLEKAGDAQKGFLEHLANKEPSGQYIVPASQWVEKLMKVTEGLTPEEIEYIKNLNWKPGSISEEELRKRIRDALKKRGQPQGDAEISGAKTPGKKETKGVIGGEDVSGKGAGKAKGKGKGGGTAEKGETAKTTKPGFDVATAPPQGIDRKKAGSFVFTILSGLSPRGQYKPGTSYSCTVHIMDKEAGKDFKLANVEITYLSRTEKPVTIKGSKFRLVTFHLYFTHDFWSEKNKFYGMGGPDTKTNYDFGRIK